MQHHPGTLQQTLLRTVQPSLCPPPGCLFPFPSLPSHLLSAEGELGSVLAVAAAALSLLSPPAPQQYLSSLMPAVAPR